MSYHKQGIEALSRGQIGKLLRGIKVRIKGGSVHEIHLTEEHSKKLHRALAKDKGITIQLDPYAIEHNQHLRNIVGHLTGRGHTGTDFGHILGGVAGKVAVAAGDRAIQEIGSGLGRHRGRPRKIYGRGGPMIPNLHYGPVSYEPTAAQLKFLEKQGVSIHGGKLANKLKHGQQVMDFMGHNYQGIASAVAPVAKPIFQAGTQRAVGYINPMSQAQSGANMLKDLFGGAVRKRGRPRKIHGGAAGPAGAYGGNYGSW